VAINNRVEKYRAHLIICALIVWLLLAGCQASETPIQPTLTPPAVVPKLIATVYISPTLDANQVAGTRAASTATATPILARPTATATAYVGVFLGEVEVDDNAPVANPDLQLPTSIVPSTLVTSCPNPPDPLFGTRWSSDPAVSAALGCPIELVASYTGTLQVFERGVMYWRPGDEIWAIATAQQRYWYAPNAPPVQPGDIMVPEGLMAPSEGFGAVWRGIPGVQDALGFARTAEQSGSISTQKFQNGLLLADGSSGQVFVLLADGRAFGPY
jgi:hypothetical protein